jgi:hypothetical protein
LLPAAKLSAFQKWLLREALKKRWAATNPAAGISFAEIISVANPNSPKGVNNRINATVSRAARRLTARGLARVVHEPAITQAERYHLKSKRAQAVKYRSWQAVIVLTDEGVKAAQHLMLAGTQFFLLLSCS